MQKLFVPFLALLVLLIAGCSSPLPGEKFTWAGREYYDMMHHEKHIDVTEYGKTFSVEFRVCPGSYETQQKVPVIRFMKKGVAKPVFEFGLSYRSGVYFHTPMSQSSTSNPGSRDIRVALVLQNDKISYCLNGHARSHYTLNNKKYPADFDSIILGAGAPEETPGTLYVCDFKIHSDPEMALAPEPEKDPALFAAQEKKYQAMGITVEGEFVPPPHHFFSANGDPVDEATRRKVASIFYDAMDQLPEEFIRNSGLKHVYIQANLKSGKMRCSGCASRPRMWLDKDAGEKTVFHEMFHVYGKNCKELWDEPTNSPDFEYHYGRKERKERRKYYEQQRKNFVSQYAMTNGSEDRSEVFAHMMIEGPRFVARTKESPWLQKKMDAIIRVCTEDVGGTDVAFWTNYLQDDSFIAREKARKAAQEKKYADLGVTIGTAAVDKDKVSGQAVEDEKLLQLYRRRIMDALDCMPAGIVREAKIRAILLVDGLSVDGAPCNTMLLPDRRILVNASKISPREIYREIYMLFDESRSDDARWEKANPPDFKYFGAEPKEKLQEHRRKNPKLKLHTYFVDTDAMRSGREDRARTFSLMCETHYVMWHHLRNNPPVREKYKLIMEFTKDHAERSFWLRRMRTTEDELNGKFPPPPKPAAKKADGKQPAVKKDDGKKPAVKKADEKKPAAKK